MIIRKTRGELEVMREGGKITGACLRYLSRNARPGITTGQLDRMAEDFIRSFGGTPEFKGYPGQIGYPNFPGTICASPNSMIVHGIPGSHRLEHGDILSIDVGVRFEGFVTDSAITIAIGDVPRETEDLLRTTRQCLLAATGQMRPGKRLGDVGNAIQVLAEGRGYGVVRNLVSHGVGRKMHEDPQIPNYGRPGTGPRLQTGMTFAIEPMITMGSYDIRIDDDDGWAIYTADGSLSAHFEHTIAVTDSGPWVLTQEDPEAVGGSGGAW